MKGLGILILAGGGGERFGGEKALFRIGGKPMIQLVFEEIRKLSREVVISCRSSREKLARMFPEAKIVPDKFDKKGALTGLMSALPEIGSEYVALVTCDSPKIKSEVLKLIFRSAQGHDGAIPKWPNGYIEPLQAVYNTGKLRRAVIEAWGDGKMRLAEVLGRLSDIVYVSTEELKKADPELESFLNVNLPEDLTNF